MGLENWEDEERLRTEFLGLTMSYQPGMDTPPFCRDEISWLNRGRMFEVHIIQL
jgi:hypothetical protein